MEDREDEERGHTLGTHTEDEVKIIQDMEMRKDKGI